LFGSRRESQKHTQQGGNPHDVFSWKADYIGFSRPSRPVTLNGRVPSRYLGPMFIYSFLFLLLLGPLFAAQQGGTVRSGELTIPGATITATKGEQKVVTTTDDSGQYLFADLPAGGWTFQVDMFGFKAAVREITLDDKRSPID